VPYFIAWGKRQLSAYCGSSEYKMNNIKCTLQCYDYVYEALWSTSHISPGLISL
jgi:hypothetical protein